MEFRGKNVVITGACNRGILFEVARQLLAAGIKNLALLDISEGATIASELKAAYPAVAEIIFIHTNVTKREQIEKAFRTVTNSWKRIDLVLCGSGIANEFNVELTIEVNLLGTIYTVFAAMNSMTRERGGNGGTIVAVSSVVGVDPCSRVPIYTASKHGVIGFMRSLAQEYYPEVTGIKFVMVCPGLCATALVKTFKGPLYEGVLEYKDGGLDAEPQTTEVVGKSFFDALKVSKNGSIWILDEGTYQPVVMNNYWAKSNPKK